MAMKPHITTWRVLVMSKDYIDAHKMCEGFYAINQELYEMPPTSET